MVIGAKGSDRLVVPCTIYDRPTIIGSHAMIDSGATGSFMSTTSTALHGIPVDPIPTRQEVTVIDRRPLLSGAITYPAKVALNLVAHMEILNLHLPQLGGYNLVLGIPWLQKHDVCIHFRKYCRSFPPSWQDHVTVAHSPQPDSRINAAPRPSTPPRPVTPRPPRFFTLPHRPVHEPHILPEPLRRAR